MMAIKWYPSPMTATAKVFKNGRSQAIRLPKEFRVSTAEVRLTRVPGGILVTEGDPWDTFQDECRSLPEGVFATLASRERSGKQERDFSAGIP
jgi:antitoxin VapB